MARTLRCPLTLGPCLQPPCGTCPAGTPCPVGTFGTWCQLQHCKEVTLPSAITLAGRSHSLTAAENVEMKAQPAQDCVSFSPWVISTHNPLFLKLLRQSAERQDHLRDDILSYSFDHSTIDVSPITSTATQFGMDTLDLWLKNLYFHDVIMPWETI